MAEGIQNIKEVLDLGIAVGQGYSGASSDGKISLEDLVFFLPALSAIGPAVKEAEKIPSEFVDIDEKEAAALIGYVSGKLPIIADEKARIIVGASLRLVIAIGQLANAVKKDGSVSGVA